MALSAHLTNNCVQAHSSGFGSHEEGNVASYRALDAHLRSAYAIDFRSCVLPRMDALQQSTSPCLISKPLRPSSLPALGKQYFLRWYAAPSTGVAANIASR